MNYHYCDACGDLFEPEHSNINCNECSEIEMNRRHDAAAGFAAGVTLFWTAIAHERAKAGRVYGAATVMAAIYEEVVAAAIMEARCEPVIDRSEKEVARLFARLRGHVGGGK